MSFRDLDQLRAEVAGEFGAFSGTREFMEGVTREVRRSRAQKLSDWGVVGELAVLRAAKWSRENPQRRKEIANRYARRPEVRERQNERARQLRAVKPIRVLVCLECGGWFIKAGRKGGTVPEFCRDACRARYRYQRRTPGARRIRRRSA